MLFWSAKASQLNQAPKSLGISRVELIGGLSLSYLIIYLTYIPRYRDISGIITLTPESINY